MISREREEDEGDADHLAGDAGQLHRREQPTQVRTASRARYDAVGRDGVTGRIQRATRGRAPLRRAVQNRPVDPRMSCPTRPRPPFEPGPVGLGCWATGGPFWSADREPLGRGEVDDHGSTRAVHRALELGVRHFDSSDDDDAGHRERVLGEVASLEPVRRACEASLRRLGMDRIDLYLLHPSGHDPATAPMPGSRTVAQVEEDLAAAARSPLTAARRAETDRLLGCRPGVSGGDPRAPSAGPGAPAAEP